MESLVCEHQLRAESTIVKGTNAAMQTSARLQVGGKTMAQAGCKPILHMNEYMKAKKLSDALVEDILTR